jgi:hypothetical protein
LEFSRHSINYGIPVMQTCILGEVQDICH